jgi:gag-polypeptide of LTR copia-type/Zinc knuckle
MSTALADQLPGSIPKLDPSGMNWAVFSLRFQDAVEAKGFWGHFDGTEPKPTPAIPSAVTADERSAITGWEKDERSAKSLLTQKLPDSTLIRVHKEVTVKNRWDAIVHEYTEKGTFAQTEMRAKFLDLKCPDKGDAREFLDSLRTKREELATMGVDIDEKDYRSTIITSLPYSLANFASSQLASAKMYATTKTIAPDSLISLISEEADRQRSQRASRPKLPRRENDGKKDEALTVSDRPKRGDRKIKGPCWNCGETGHLKNKCPKPKKEGSSSKGDANAVVPDLDEEAAFFMEPFDFEDDGSNDESDVSSFVVTNGSEDGWTTEDLSEVDWSETNSFVDVDMDLVPDEPEAANSISPDENTTRAEIIDSGCTRHLTPDRGNLTNYVEISPKSF